MGWKPGKLLKKAFKGVKKVVKKIGKGIKKVAFKLFGALGKLGPLGQLALMFIGIPPVISNFFGSIGGAVGGWVSRVAPNMAKAFNAIKTAGQGAYNTITEAIGNGIDRVMNFTKGKGFTLSGDRTSIFGGVSAKDIKVPDLTSNVKVDASGLPELVDGKLQFTDAPTTLGDRLTAAVETGGTPQSLSEIAAQSAAPKSLLAKDATAEVLSFEDAMKIDFGTGDKVAAKTFKEKTFGEKAQDYIEEGVLQGLSGKTTQTIMGDPPTQNVVHFNPSDYMTPTTQQRLEAATWNTINNSYQRAGSSFGAAGDAMTPYFTELANFDKDINYQRQLKQLNPVFNRISY